jgi:hypothetical protein
VPKSKEVCDRKETLIHDYGKIINTECAKYDIPPELLLQLFYHESKFDPHAKNPKSSAYGLGQIIGGTWESISKKL